MDKVWTSRITDVGDALADRPRDPSDSTTLKLCGFVSNDGRRVLVRCKGYLSFTSFQFVTSDQGVHWGPMLVCNADSLSKLFVCDDERIFITRRGSRFGRGGQAEIVDVYSTRTWKYSRSWTFGFGGGEHNQNFAIIPHPAIGKPIFCIISTYPSPESNNNNDQERCLDMLLLPENSSMSKE